MHGTVCVCAYTSHTVGRVWLIAFRVCRVCNVLYWCISYWVHSENLCPNEHQNGLKLSQLAVESERGGE